MKKQYFQKAYLDECFDLDDRTGGLTWKPRPLQHFKNEHGMRIFNSRFSGKPAGSVNSKGYLVVNMQGCLYLVHRFIFCMTRGVYAECIDHVNGVKTDNRPSNLREATYQQNVFNASKSKRNKSGVKGVHWNKSRSMWQAQCMIGGKQRSLGMFNTLDEAAAALIVYRESRQGEFANHG